MEEITSLAQTEHTEQQNIEHEQTELMPIVQKDTSKTKAKHSSKNVGLLLSKISTTIKTPQRRKQRNTLTFAIGVLIILIPIAIYSLKHRPPPVQADSIIGFNEGYGTTVHDSSGDATGTITGAAWKTGELCKEGNCLYFDGSNDYVSFADNDSYDIADTDTVTLEGWVRHSPFTPSIDIDHEDGGTADYTSVTDPDSDFSVTEIAAQNGTDYGLAIQIDDTNSVYGQKDISTDTNGIVRYGFYLDPNGLTMSMDEFVIAKVYRSGSLGISYVYLEYSGSDYRIRSTISGDSGDSYTSYYIISDAPHRIEVAITRASSDVSSDATMQLWIDGIHKESVTGIDNYDQFSNFASARLGAVDSVDSGTSGTFYIDELQIHAENPQMIMSKYETIGADGGYKVYYENDGDIGCGIDNENTYFPSDSVASYTADYDDNAWHHFTCVKDGTDSLSLYLDTKLITTDSSITSSSLANNDSFYIGIDGDGTSNPYAGFIDQLAIRRTARTQDQIKTDYLEANSDRGTSVKFADSEDWLSDGLVGYWKMDDDAESEGDTVVDSSGNGNTGTLYGDDGVDDNGTGMTATASGKFATAAEFDGTDDYIESSYSSTYNITNNLTLAAWVYLTDASDSRSILSHSYQYGVYIDNSTRYLRSILRNSDETYEYPNTYYQIPLNTWSHIVMTFSDSVVKFFLDGQEIYTTNLATEDLVSHEMYGINIGAWYQNNIFQGKIDEARIYNRTLSPSEVQKLYKWAPGPTAYYSFDDGNGTTAYDQGTNKTDGTLEPGGSNVPQWVSGKFGNALLFDGDDDIVDVNENSKWSIDTDENITITAWVKLTGDCDDTYGYIIGDGAGPLFYLQKQSPGSYNMGWYTVSSATSDYLSFDMNKWYHVAMVKEDTTAVSFYRDGVLITRDTTFTDEDETGGVIHIGGHPSPVNMFKGAIDELKFYRYARTPAQILEDMNAGHPLVGTPVGSPILHYTLDEGYGDTAHDSSPQGNNGNLYGTCPEDATCPSWSNSGKFGKALSFDGGDYLVVSHDTSLVMTQDMTISAWINKNDTSGSEMIVEKGLNDDDNYAFYVGDDKLTFEYLDSGGPPTYSSYQEQTGSVTSAGTWYHVVAVFDDTNDKFTFYNNGVESYSTTNTESLYGDQTDDLYIGRQNAASPVYFNGKIDEVKIYNFALTDSQVLTEYNQGKAQVLGSISTDGTGSEMTPSFSSASSYCPPGDTTGYCDPPVAEWKFDEKEGTTVNDTSENNNISTTWTGDMTWQHAGHCHNGSCLEFDGDDDVVRFAETTSTDLGALTDSYTISAWIKTTTDYTTNSGDIVCKTIGNYPFCLFVNTAEKLQFYMSASGGGSASATGTTTLNDGVWHYVTGVRDRSTDKVYVYVDGKLDGQGDDNLTLSAVNDRDISIGNSGTDYIVYDFNGQIDEVRIYDYARTQEQIAWDYNKGAPVGYWALDECEGTTAHDSSGNGYDGTISIGAGGDNTSAGTCAGSSGEAWYEGETGKLNASLDFDGDSDWVELPDDIWDDYTQGSISAWVKTDGSGSNYDVISYGDETSIFSSLDFGAHSSGVLRAALRVSTSSNEVYCNTNYTIIPNTWTHIMWTNDGSNYALYANGNEIPCTWTENGTGNEGDWFDDIASNCENASIGALNRNSGSLTNYFDGQIDEVKIFNYALTKQQVQTDYTAGAVRFE
jgi:hypothetical protein